jgi:hypothetical protein
MKIRKSLNSNGPKLAYCYSDGVGSLLGVAQPTAKVARPAQAGATRSARALGGHRAQSRHGGATPTGEPMAEVRWGLHPKHQ